MDHRANCKAQNYKTFRGQQGENLNVLGCGDDFLDTAPKAKSVKAIIYKLGFI